MEAEPMTHSSHGPAIAPIVIGRRLGGLAGITVTLLAAALAPLGASAQSDRHPAEGAGVAPDLPGQLEIVVPNSHLAPTPRQHIQFILEEHGYDIVLPDPGLTPTPRQRINFILEEHGYDIVLPEPALIPAPCQRMQFLLEEHGYDAEYPCN
jgi:hypothetical protein